jgi:hypothetical protein
MIVNWHIGSIKKDKKIRGGRVVVRIRSGLY